MMMAKSSDVTCQATSSSQRSTLGKTMLKLVFQSYRSCMVVESGGKNIEIAVTAHKDGFHKLEEDEIDEYVAEIEAEKAVPRLQRRVRQRRTDSTQVQIVPLVP